MVVRPLDEKVLPEFSFTWRPLLGAYHCDDPRGVTLETTLTSCSCALSTFIGPPCEHSLALLALAEDGAITEGPLAVAAEVNRQRAAQKALMNDLLNRAWDYALERPDPSDSPCLFCGRPTSGALVEGWAVVCSECLCEGAEDD